MQSVEEVRHHGHGDESLDEKPGFMLIRWRREGGWAVVEMKGEDATIQMALGPWGSVEERYDE